MKRKTSIAVLSILLVALIVILLVSFTGNTVKSESIKIGVFTPLTGDAAIYGQAMKDGLDLAAQEINEQGLLNMQIELIYEDTHLDSKEAVTAMNKFINIDKVDFVIAAEGSGATSAAVPLADQTRTLTIIGIASSPTLREAGDYVFRVIPSDAYQAVEIANLAKELDSGSAGILYVNDAFGIGFKDAFTESFSEKVYSETFEASDSDFRSQLTKLKAKDPEVLVVVARKEFPNILKQIKEYGIESQVIGSVELNDESLVEAAGSAAEGVLVPFYAEQTDYMNYNTKFQQRYSKEPSLFSDYGFDALTVLAKAVENADSIESEKVKNELYRTVYYGATGVVQFDNYGEVTGKEFEIYQIRNGKFVLY